MEAVVDQHCIDRDAALAIEPASIGEAKLARQADMVLQLG
jgi:hypothetical protein